MLIWKSECTPYYKQQLELNGIYALRTKDDDLERHERNNQQEVTDLEKKINEMTEKLTLLENELAEKQTPPKKYTDYVKKCEPLKDLCLWWDRSELSVTMIHLKNRLPNNKSKRLGMCLLRQIKDTNGNDNPEIAMTPLTIAGGDGKGFANCVNRIVKDLMLKVDRLEGILTGLRVQSVKR
ncbi:unnamed protein product [Cylicocyclus nassatus]|uniref:Uncharacterized protein n=1 Tax=Cylicocyclus nassatus TaxID=53992 RepID=A0AA36H1J0_CYLNA|nr:unnamed protein product [Cylicocyclus nassatus]